MRTFELPEISQISGLSTGQIEQAISRNRLQLQGEGRPGRARQFSPMDAFMICILGELRRLGLDWKCIVGSTAFPWPIDDLFKIDKMEFFLLTPIPDQRRGVPKKFEISLVTPEDFAGHLRAYKAGAGVLIDASVIAKRIKAFAKQGMGRQSHQSPAEVGLMARTGGPA
jgi:hypothetical protein